MKEFESNLTIYGHLRIAIIRLYFSVSCHSTYGGRIRMPGGPEGASAAMGYNGGTI